MINRSYLKLARQGNNQWWRYCLGTLFIWFFSGYIAVSLSILVVNLAVVRIDTIATSDQAYLNFIATRIENVFPMLAVFIVLKWLHQRHISTVISAEGKLSIKRILIGIVTCLILILLPFFIDWLFGVYSWLDIVEKFGLERWSWLPFIMISTIIQSAGEEFVFRGYLLQGLYLLTSRTKTAVTISSLAFVSVHYSPPYLASILSEGIPQLIFYFVFAVMCAVVTLKDNRIELAIGIHSGWNIFHIMLSGIS